MTLNLKRTDAWERLPWERRPAAIRNESRRDAAPTGKMPLPRLPIESWERHLAATLTNPFLLDKPHRISHGQDAAPIEATEVA